MTKETNSEKENNNNPVIPFIPDGKLYFSKGVDAFYQRKFDQALQWMKKAIEIAPDKILYSAQLSVVYTEIGAYHQANQILMELVKNNDEDFPDCYYLLANNYAHLGLLKDAQKYASLYLEKEPEGEFRSESEQLITLLELGIAEDEADETFHQEDAILIYQETAFYHTQRKEWKLACAVLSEMLEQFPNYTMAHQLYHYALFFLGNREKAIELEEQLYQSYPNSTHTMTNLLIFYYETGRLNQVETLLQRLKNIYPIHFEQALRIAVAFAYVNYFEQAYHRFCSLPAAKLQNHFDYFRYFAKTAHELEHPLQAEKIWTQGCKRHPELAEEHVPWIES